MHTDKVHFIFAVLLAIFSFGLLILYVIATHHELNLLNDYLGEDDIPRIMPKTYLVALGLAILFGALMSVTEKLLIYSIIMVSYNLFDFWGNWQVAKYIKLPLEKKLKASQDQELSQALQTIIDFYFGNPTLPRIVTIMFVNWIVVCLTLAYFYTNNEVLRNGGYALILVNIAVGEIVVHRWRFKTIYKLQ